VSDEANLVQVEIQGRVYNLRSAGDPRALKELAAHVDGRMTEIAGATATVDTSRLAILTALNLADELFEERRRKAGVPEAGAGARREERLIRLLDDILVA
jgi:cell division protein ZapA